jgi:3-dehydroquinate synthase
MNVLQPIEETRAYDQVFNIRCEYAVRFTDGIFEPLNPTFRDIVAKYEPQRRHRVAVFIDSGVADEWPQLTSEIIAYVRAHAATIDLVALPEIVPGGEQIKHGPEYVTRLTRRLFDLGMDRHSYVVAIGGGAVLDLVGFVAATLHRGIRHIRIPTTVLAQADSGIGVKNGYNAFGVKNLIGSFAPPFAVLNDARFLRTLDRRDVISGMGEAVKVALIRDGEFFQWIEAHANALANADDDALHYLIVRCAELHMRQIATAGDPFETGSARPLDYGHWSAHKLESLTGYALRHGEAVAIGCALDARYSVLQGLLPEGQDERISGVLESLGFRLWDSALLHRDDNGQFAVISGLREFQEHLGGELTITLLAGIGRGIEVHEMDEHAVLASIDWLRSRSAE